MALAGSALLLAACSDAGDASSIRRRANSDSPASAAPSKAPNDGSMGGSSASPTPAPPPSAPAPATPDGGATTPPATPAPAGSCANPKCFGVGGIGGCKATDGTGANVTMGCQDGACACLAGGQTTATFAGDVNSASDAAQLFLANCDCL